MEIPKVMSVKGSCLIAKLGQYLDNEEAQNNEGYKNICKTQVGGVPEQVRVQLEYVFSFSFFMSDFGVTAHLDFIELLHAYLAHGIDLILVDVFVDFIEIQISKFHLLLLFFEVEQTTFILRVSN